MHARCMHRPFTSCVRHYHWNGRERYSLATCPHLGMGWGGRGWLFRLRAGGWRYGGGGEYNLFSAGPGSQCIYRTVTLLQFKRPCTKSNRTNNFHLFAIAAVYAQCTYIITISHNSVHVCIPRRVFAVFTIVQLKMTDSCANKRRRLEHAGVPSSADLNRRV